MKSVIQGKKECWLCKTKQGLHCHHVFNGPNRTKADNDGLTVYLCWSHHQQVHNIQSLDLRFKRIGQRIYMKRYNKTKEEFISRYGKDYD